MSQNILHFEMEKDAYEKIKSAFDEVRKEIDQGMFGDTSEWKALQNARGKLYAMGELLKKELVIVQDPVEDPETTQGGAA